MYDILRLGQLHAEVTRQLNAPDEVQNKLVLDFDKMRNDKTAAPTALVTAATARLERRLNAYGITVRRDTAALMAARNDGLGGQASGGANSTCGVTTLEVSPPKIYLREGLSPVGDLVTLAHEAAHAVIEPKRRKGLIFPPLAELALQSTAGMSGNYLLAEVIAEQAAYLIGRFFDSGVPVAYHAAYICGYMSILQGLSAPLSVFDDLWSTGSRYAHQAARELLADVERG